MYEFIFIRAPVPVQHTLVTWPLHTLKWTCDWESLWSVQSPWVVTPAVVSSLCRCWGRGSEWNAELHLVVADKTTRRVIHRVSAPSPTANCGGDTVSCLSHDLWPRWTLVAAVLVLPLSCCGYWGRRARSHRWSWIVSTRSRTWRWRAATAKHLFLPSSSTAGATQHEGSTHQGHPDWLSLHSSPSNWKWKWRLICKILPVKVVVLIQSNVFGMKNVFFYEVLFLLYGPE